MKKVPFYNLTITNGFWAERQKTVEETTVWAVYDRFKETGRIDTMNCKESTVKPHIFWGSDVFKWIEGAAYILEKKEEPKLRNLIDALVEMVQEGVREDGYYNSYYNNPDVTEPRFSNRDHHELYSLGHMIEAGIALAHIGDDRLLRLCCKNADLVDKIFRQENSAAFTTPGHEELELALVRLWHATGEKKYLDLAEFFVRQRGANQKDDPVYNKNQNYCQSHLPVTEQTTAEGHAVRAMYLYCAIADLAEALDDQELRRAAETLFSDVYEKKMYITGGLGSQHKGERFTVPYHLPNREAYAETCAALGLVLFGSRLSAQAPDSRYGDAVERALYNGMIAGLSLEGDSFFYVNPLEMDLARQSIPQASLPKTQRQKVFHCSCCPPNLVRLIPSIGNFIYSYNADTLFVHQYIPNKGVAEGAAVAMETDYPANGKIKVTYEGSKTLALRKPAWCKKFKTNVPCVEEKGYLYFNTNTVTVDFEMEPTFYTATHAVHENAGRVALMRGPIVYCLEGQDQPEDLFLCRVDPTKPVQVTNETYGGFPLLDAAGSVMKKQAALYAPFAEAPATSCTLRYIPYYTFANRGEDDMMVWVLT